MIKILLLIAALVLVNVVIRVGRSKQRAIKQKKKNILDRQRSEEEEDSN